MMKLFEVLNGYTGESYVRCYVWAETEAAALELARATYEAEERGRKFGEPRATYWERLTAYELFDASAAPFATVPNDSGWSDDR